MTNFRLRVELTDRPGVLAGATAALAALGVDVLAVDVLEENGPTIVDELVVSLPPRVTVQHVEDALRMAGAIDLLSTAADTTVRDPVVRVLEQALTVFTSPWDAAAKGAALAVVAYADSGQLLEVNEALRFPLARRALDTQIPAAGLAGPDASPLAIPSGWVLWVAQAGPDPAFLAVVGRRMNVRFSAAEAVRLRAFANLLSTVGVMSAY